MDASGISVVDDHAGFTFGVELYIPWDAPEAVVDVSSAGVVPLCSVPDAKTKYRQSRPSCCTFCGILIKCDMHWHVARCHLDLAQLWRCPVSWCTVWKGTPQDLMDHLRGAHDVPGEIKSSLEKYLPPWTVTRQVWTDSLTPRHSGISTDVLLFIDIGLSLVHHYRVHKRGLPHIAFRQNYLSQLRALLPLPAVLPTAGGRPTLPARVRCVRRDLPALWVPCLDRPDARSGAGGQSRSWSRLCRTFRSSRCRTRWLRRGAAVLDCRPPPPPRCCQCRIYGYRWCGLVGDSGSGSVRRGWGLSSRR